MSGDARVCAPCYGSGLRVLAVLPNGDPSFVDEPCETCDGKGYTLSSAARFERERRERTKAWITACRTQLGKDQP